MPSKLDTISLVGVSRRFVSGSGELNILNDVSLEVHFGDVLGVIGPSGSGKSTLLNILALIDVPSSGEVFLEGARVSPFENERASTRCLKIGFVFQHFNLLPGLTAIENVMVPALLAGSSRGEARRQALALLDELGLVSRAGHFPPNLSGGEMQRVAIARALINKPILLLADEPTGSLDSVTGAEVIKILTKNRDIAVVMATHSDAVVRSCSRVLQIKDGRLNELAAK